MQRHSRRAVVLWHLGLALIATNVSTLARAAAPTSQDVDVYSSLCKIGSQTTVVVSTAVVAVNPGVSTERRREIVYLANELESFKQKMEKAIASVPGTFYDKRDSTDKKPREDSRLVGLADFSRYKAFQSASGGLDFSNATHNDIVILCNTYASEIAEYKAFGRQYQPLGLPPYGSSDEVRRICVSAAKGR
jgi:hypothetical protein